MMRLRAAVLLSIGLLALVGCGGSGGRASRVSTGLAAAGGGGTLAYALPALPATIDPLAAHTRAQLIDVLFVIVPQSLLLDIAGPAEAFRLANLHREARGLPPRFHLRFAGPSPTLPTSVGLTR